jgi:hypothetical protein
MKYDRYKHLSGRPLSSPGFGGFLSYYRRRPWTNDQQTAYFMEASGSSPGYGTARDETMSFIEQTA